MTRLSVNINKIALIRNSRNGNLPNLLQFAKDCEDFGAEGITVHPRPDQRHIRFSDIPLLKEIVRTEFNIEGYPSHDFMELVLKNKPHQVTLVPDGPNVLTSDSGWDVISNHQFLKNLVSTLKEAGMRVAIFVNADPEMVYASKEVDADRVELYTGDYANVFPLDPQKAIESHILASEMAIKCNIGMNAGHDLNLDNLGFYKTNIRPLLEVSIGHSMVCDALYYGIENCIPLYKKCLLY